MVPLEMIRVFLVDDHPLMRTGLRMVIESEHDLCVCGEAKNAEIALESLVDANPNIAVVDISLSE